MHVEPQSRRAISHDRSRRLPSTAIVLGAPILVAFSNLLAGPATARLGAPTFNLLRLAVAAFVAAAGVLVSGVHGISSRDAAWLAASALVGLTCGDTALYAALARLGARRAGLLYATNGPITALLAFAVLGEALSGIQLAGIGAVVAGVWLAIVFRDGTGAWDGTPGQVVPGILFGLGGATCQAIGVVLARPVMAGGADPVLAVLVRVGAGFLGLLIVLCCVPAVRPSRLPDRTEVGAVLVSGALGTAVATMLILSALRAGDAGLVATLASLTPIVLLVLLWMTTRRRPAILAWCGAALAVAGAVALVRH